MITIVGLGPGDPELITRRTWRLLSEAPEVFVRTRRHPAVAAVQQITSVRSYDAFYEQHVDFGAVYAAIAADVVERGRQGDIIYAVPGDPAVAEATPRQIRALAARHDIPVLIEPGVSFLEPSFAAVGADPIEGVQIVDAIDLAQQYHPLGASEQAMMVVQLYSRLLAGDVKLTLLNAYPPEHQVTLISAAGSARMRLQNLPLYALDRQDVFDDLTSLWVPALPMASSYNALQELIAHLRAPDGCPWDREQTHESLRPYLLEESYEVLDALDRGDTEALAEELGDLLIQVALHVQIAIEEGEFQLHDVISHVVAKLIRRHPHVFSDTEVHNAADVARNWESIKEGERQQAAKEHKNASKDLLDGMPEASPALALAQGYISRLSRVGYPLPESDFSQASQVAQALLQVVAAAQVAGIDAESSLRSACRQLKQRYEKVAARAAREGHSLTGLSADEQRRLWLETEA